MLATDLQDILFGTPYPVASEANLGVMKADMVNIVIHGHEPVLSEMIVAVAQTQEMNDYAKSKGAKGIQLSGICCTANEMLQRHGVDTKGLQMFFCPYAFQVTRTVFLSSQLVFRLLWWYITLLS